jgi:hypothetical protein
MMEVNHLYKMASAVVISHFAQIHALKLFALKLCARMEVNLQYQRDNAVEIWDYAPNQNRRLPRTHTIFQMRAQ